MAKTINFYSIRTLTNLHVGSGDNNYGVVDNQVQRDVNTGLPTIHSSSLKGALREFFRTCEISLLPKEQIKDYKESAMIRHMFGFIGEDDGSKKQKSHAGEWQFLSADLLSRPLRSDKAPFFNATSPEVLKLLAAKFVQLGLALPEGLETLALHQPERGKPLVFDPAWDEAVIEDLDWQAEYHDMDLKQFPWLNSVFGERLVLVNNQDFTEIELPVIARNYLENGESKNLWYEEIVPYDARFGVFMIQTTEHLGEFETALKSPVQIGANASIGYGLCQLTNQSTVAEPVAL